jgi:hypothetical protein
MLRWQQRIFYSSIIVAALHDKGGVPFEDWFVALAYKAWGEDFEPVRAQGSFGDLKCDGHRISTSTIYQCYAPRRAVEEKVAGKVRTDFEGARDIWGPKMKQWTIVINDREGLDVSATKEVELLRAENPNHAITVLGPAGILRLGLDLPLDALADLCGAMLDETDYQQWRLAFADVSKIAEHLVDPTLRPGDGPIAPPPADKIKRNSLEPEIVTLLMKGNILTKQVEGFFSRNDQVELEGRVASKLSAAYIEMRGAEIDPTQIFYALIDLCGGLARPPGERHAVLGLMTYFFNKCDIFEAEEAA